jgi:hypothetical protein
MIMSHTISSNQNSVARTTTGTTNLHETLAPAFVTSTLEQEIEQVARKFVATLTQATLASFNGRLARGLELAKVGAVSSVLNPAHPRCFQVRSTEGLQTYQVDLDTKTCTCPDSQKGNTCKHRVAAYYFEQTLKVKPTSGSPVEMQTPIVAPPLAQTTAIQETKTPSLPESKSASIPQKKLSRTDQILADLGFEPDLPKPTSINNRAEVTCESTNAPVQLGTLYRHYLHGNNLGGQEFSVRIIDVTKEKVTPHPSQPVVEKWCLWVDGLPTGLGNGILFGTRGEEDLMAIFGQVEIETLKGKQVVIYPKPMNVAGQPKVSIRFRSAK